MASAVVLSQRETARTGSPSPQTTSFYPRGREGIVLRCGFESGNLASATRVSEHEIDLEVRADTCNDRFRLWFYFSCSNVQASEKIIFSVTNMSKSRSSSWKSASDGGINAWS